MTVTVTPPLGVVDVDDELQPAGVEPVYNTVARRLRMLAALALLCGLGVLIATSAPWFEFSTKNSAIAATTPEGASCAQQGGMLVQDPSGLNHCQVVTAKISARQLAAQTKTMIRSGGPSEGIAYVALPQTVAGWPAATFWAMLGVLLVLVACITQAMSAAVLAPLATMAAWSATSQLVAYGSNPAHGGSFNTQQWGLTAMKAALTLLVVASGATGVQVVKIRRALWAKRKEQGLPATALGKALQSALARGAEMAREAADPSKPK